MVLCCVLGPRDETPFVDDATEEAAASISRCAAAVLAMAEVVIDGSMLGPVTVTVIPVAGPAPPPEDPVLEPDDPVKKKRYNDVVGNNTTMLFFFKESGFIVLDAFYL